MRVLHEAIDRLTKGDIGIALKLLKQEFTDIENLKAINLLEARNSLLKKEKDSEFLPRNELTIKENNLIYSILEYTYGLKVDSLEEATIVENKIEEPQLFITRIINPPNDNGAFSAIWLSCIGHTNYIIDSISILHWRGNLHGSTATTIHPIAEYSFEFKYNGFVSYPLIPSINIEGESNIFFTLKLLPDRIGSAMGNLFVTLGFHTSDGEIGEIPIVLQPKEAYIGKLLEENIVIKKFYNTNIIWIANKFGFIRDCNIDHQNLRSYNYLLDSTSELLIDIESECRYNNMPELAEERILSDRLHRKENIEKEVAKAIQTANYALASGKLPLIIQGIHALNPVAIDLSSLIDDKEIDNALYNLESTISSTVIQSVILRHIIKPSDFIVEFMNKHFENLDKNLFDESESVLLLLIQCLYEFPTNNSLDLIERMIAHWLLYLETPLPEHENHFANQNLSGSRSRIKAAIQKLTAFFRLGKKV